MSTELENKTGYTLLKPQGDLLTDEDNGLLKDKIIEAARAGKETVIDLQNVSLVSSGGVAKFLIAYRELRERNKSVYFVNVNPAVREIFQGLSFSEIFNVLGDAPKFDYTKLKN